MHMYQRRPDSGPPHLRLWKSRKGKRQAYSTHIQEDNWPVQKSVLVNKYLQQFHQFTNSIDFEKTIVTENKRQS